MVLIVVWILVCKVIVMKIVIGVFFGIIINGKCVFIFFIFRFCKIVFRLYIRKVVLSIEVVIVLVKWSVLVIRKMEVMGVVVMISIC